MSKYRNVRTEGFDSKRERNHALLLKSLEAAGNISDLRFQVPFVLIPKIGSQRECKYIADFTYVEQGALVVADSKGVKTPVYLLKKKLMKWIHGVDILEL